MWGYLIQLATIQLYESYRGYLTSVRMTKYLMFGGFVGIFVRILIVFITYIMGVGLYGLSICCAIDFLCRDLYYKVCSMRVRELL